MSTDPVGRMGRLHRRWFEFFDLDRALLLELETVREARSIEAGLKSMFRGDAASAPLAVGDDAGGKYEWFAGISDRATLAAHQCSLTTGGPLHVSIAAWLREQWRDSSAAMFDWSAHMLERAELIHFNAIHPDQNVYVEQLQRVFELCDAIGLPIATLLPDAVLQWRTNGFGDSRRI